MARVQCTCRTCGAVFSVTPSRAAGGGGVYCSNPCRRIRVNRVCSRCGRSFRASANDITRGFGRFCSKRCGRLSHGESHDATTPEYRAWGAMLSRCLNPRMNNFKDYGGRGITVCDRWRHSYEAFLADVGRRPSTEHSLHRIDNDGHYEKGNVVWALLIEQNTHKRSNRLLTFGGVTQSLSMWARATGLNPEALGKRLNQAGWSLERALTTPSRRAKQRR